MLGNGNTLVEMSLRFVYSSSNCITTSYFVVQGCKFHQQLLPVLSKPMSDVRLYKKIAGDEIALFVGQRIDDSDFLFGC